MDGALSGIGAVGGLDPSLMRPPASPNSAIEKASGFAPEVGAAPSAGGVSGQSFGRILHQFVDGINDTQKTAEMETRKVLLGQSDNLHQAMIASEESGVAFRLMVEVRNKLVEGFQEVMRMQV